MDLLEIVRKRVSEEPRVLDWAACVLPEEIPGAGHLRRWIEQGMHGDMRWMENTLAERVRPRGFFGEWSHALIVLWRSPQPLQRPEGNACVAAYAQGEDYHRVLGDFLYRTGLALQQGDGDFRFRVFCDAQPVAEREIAVLAGLGWRGKNTMLIHPRHGSSFLIGGLLVNRSLERRGPLLADQEFCGGCRRCIDACPTRALSDSGVLDARRCIAYITIEKRHIDREEPDAAPWIFGCDWCQLACPWNQRHLRSTEQSRFWPQHIQEWNDLLKPGSGLTNRIKKTPLSRVGKKGLKQNLRRLEKNTESIS